MAHHELTRRQKALTLVPVLLVSGAWTLSMTNFGSATAAGDKDGRGTLPDGTSVPSRAIQAPANVPVDGSIGPGVPAGDADAVVAGASTSGIPSAALSAYQRAAQVIDAADPTCHLPWELVAAIGRVESDHGRYDGNVLGSDGVSKPGIFGPALDGTNGTQAVADSDAGQLDHDTTSDRAVGPMQFIPTTWQVVKVDADGDGQRNPQDIDDASLATAVYLCSGSESLGKESGQRAAVYRYNHSQSYVDVVLRIMRAYQEGDYTAVPDGTFGGTSFGAAPPISAPAAPTPKAKSNLVRPSKTPQAAAPTSAAPSSSGSGGNSGSGSGYGSSPKPKTSSTPKAPSLPTTAPTQVTQPVVQVLNDAQALALCQQQISSLSSPLIPSSAASKCQAKVVGKTAADAAAAIPNTVTGLLSWLGL